MLAAVLSDQLWATCMKGQHSLTGQHMFPRLGIAKHSTAQHTHRPAHVFTLGHTAQPSINCHVQALEEQGQGRVLVVDGGASMR